MIPVPAAVDIVVSLLRGTDFAAVPQQAQAAAWVILKKKNI